MRLIAYKKDALLQQSVNILEENKSIEIKSIE